MSVESGEDAGAPGGAATARLGTEVGPYAIVRLVGMGGMGAVYEARHSRLGRRVAIKFLLPELAARSDVLRRFENEAVAAGGLEHPNLVAVTDLGRAADGAPYLVMEFLQGEDCARLLERVGPLPAPRAADLVLQASRGIAVVHAAGIIHRDLKPENLFVTKAGDGSDLVKVLDFGIAKLRPSDAHAGTRTGATLGTAHYMSPEQARGAAEVDARADVWSLGVVLYELLGGRKPFEGHEFLNVVHQILSVEPRPLGALRPGLPRELVDTVARAMHKDPQRRFPSVEALGQALGPWTGRAPTGRTSASVTADGASSPDLDAVRLGPRAGVRRAGTTIAVVVAVMATLLVLGGRWLRGPAHVGAASTADIPAPPPSPPEIPAAAVAAPAQRPTVTEPPVTAPPLPPVVEADQPARKMHEETRRRAARSSSGETPRPAGGRPLNLDPNPF